MAGPFHHYCKAIKPEVLQCLLSQSTEPNAVLTDVEYFVANPVSPSRQDRPSCWNKFYHDHEVEIATGRVQVRTCRSAQAKERQRPQPRTDGIIFHPVAQGAKSSGRIGRTSPRPAAQTADGITLSLTNDRSTDTLRRGKEAPMRSAIAIIGWRAAALTVTGCAANVSPTK